MVFVVHVDRSDDHDQGHHQLANHHRANRQRHGGIRQNCPGTAHNRGAEGLLLGVATPEVKRVRAQQHRSQQQRDRQQPDPKQIRARVGLQPPLQGQR